MPIPDEISEIGDADVSYMRRMARGDSHALSSLYQRHGGVALALAERMLGGRDAAEDAVQDAFVALWRHAGAYRAGGAAPRTWLLTIVRNRCIDELRRRSGGLQRVDLDEAQPYAIERDPWPEIWKRHCGDALRGALADLSREQREVIELGFFSGHSHAQIAERLGAPLGTVKKRMRTGLKRLRAALDDRFAESISP
jgi:RNA polymerase sigma-70 factor (ECF subfamily)